jgi:biopolymer transport protein ExbB
MIFQNRIAATLATIAVLTVVPFGTSVSAAEPITAPSAALTSTPAPVSGPGPASAVVQPAKPITDDENAAGKTAKEPIENPYGLEALWKSGDLIARGTLIILLIMSMGSWYILLTKLVDHLRIAGQAKEARNKFWKSASVPAGITTLGEGSPYRFIAETGSRSTQHHDGALLEQIDLNTWVTMSIQRAVEKVQSRLQDGLAFLATVGSTAPFVGLFGTVWGIYHALTAIGIAGQASIDKVAGPVGEALIMTAIGLAVAVPAVLGYNFLVRRNKGAMEEVRSFSSDLHAVLLSGAMSSSQVAQSAPIKKVG